MPSESAGGVVLNEKGEVALVEQWGNSWSFPKGTREEGEDLRDTARREIAEETGLTELQFRGELGSYERYSIGKDGVGETQEWGSKKRTFFLYTTDHTELRPQDPDGEVTRARWVSLSDIPGLLTHPKDKEFFESVLPKIKAILG